MRHFEQIIQWIGGRKWNIGYIVHMLALSFYIVVIRVDLSDMTSPRNATRYYIMHLMKSERIRESAAKQGRSLPLFSFSISNRLYRKLYEDESGKPNF